MLLASEQAGSRHMHRCGICSIEVLADLIAVAHPADDSHQALCITTLASSRKQ